MKKFYSKNGEDYLLWTFFKHKKSGFFLDIGAFDGRYMSNTYVFERSGWQGICIEPHPDVFPLCAKNRPGSRCIMAACTHSSANNTIRFFAEKTGLLSTTVNSADIHHDIRRRYERKNLPFSGFTITQAAAFTVDQIMKAYAPGISKIDFISIDTEGNEEHVVQGIDFSNISARVIVVEANNQSAEKSLKAQLANAGGYIPARKIGVNLFFAETKEDAAALASIPIQCRISKQIHPIVPSFTPKKRMQDQILQDSHAL